MVAGEFHSDLVVDAANKASSVFSQEGLALRLADASSWVLEITKAMGSTRFVWIALLDEMTVANGRKSDGILVPKCQTNS